MAYRPYSARFMSGRGQTRKEIYTVPEGRRIVVRHFAVLFWQAAASYAVLEVHGIAVYFVSSQVANTAVFEEVRFTAYERETVSLYVNGPDTSYAIDGFLFADDNGTPDDAENVIELVRVDPRAPAGEGRIDR